MAKTHDSPSKLPNNGVIRCGFKPRCSDLDLFAECSSISRAAIKCGDGPVPDVLELISQIMYSRRVGAKPTIPTSLE